MVETNMKDMYLQENIDFSAILVAGSFGLRHDIWM